MYLTCILRAIYYPHMTEKKERTVTTAYRFSEIAKHKLRQITNWEARASDNNTIIWLIEKEFRKQKRRRQDDK